MGEVLSKSVQEIQHLTPTNWEDLNMALELQHTLPREQLLHCDLTLFHKLLKGAGSSDLRVAYKAKLDRELTFLLFDLNQVVVNCRSRSFSTNSGDMLLYTHYRKGTSTSWKCYLRKRFSVEDLKPQKSAIFFSSFSTKTKATPLTKVGFVVSLLLPSILSFGSQVEISWLISNYLDELTELLSTVADGIAKLLDQNIVNRTFISDLVSIHMNLQSCFSQTFCHNSTEYMNCSIPLFCGSVHTASDVLL